MFADQHGCRGRMQPAKSGCGFIPLRFGPNSCGQPVATPSPHPGDSPMPGAGHALKAIAGDVGQGAWAPRSGLLGMS